MARTAALFEPTTDTFGALTLQPVSRRARIVVRGKTVSAEDRQSRFNLLIALAFVLSCLVLISALYVADQAMFKTPHTQAVATTGAQVDYD